MTSPTATTARDRMLARHVRGGANPADGARLLDQLLEQVGPGALGAALVYQNFATPASVDGLIAAHLKETAA